MQRLFEVLRLMRNSVHYDALGLVQDDGAYLVTFPRDAQESVRALLRASHLAGARSRWASGCGRPET